MTNLEAFQIYFKDEAVASLVLVSNGIEVAGTDDNELSGAYGMIERLKNPNWSQGSTSEDLTAQARAALYADAKRIFDKNGIVFPLEGGIPKVNAKKW